MKKKTNIFLICLPYTKLTSEVDGDVQQNPYSASLAADDNEVDVRN